MCFAIATLTLVIGAVLGGVAVGICAGSAR
jgi:hypothetical protein